ncbi:hypothetical protein EJ02DRAFT_121513 [Clathrospora elynae]|uniref:Ig-like domain-containing protein n=1 Tax=Clathrospora elynae TaxID=706981 RepID=A0A6A5SVC0_9PLEO|nr:hypothetical protein EJ02DRAFT_121513 [Clathrospora elynae]
MRVHVLSTLLLPTLAAGRLFKDVDYLKDVAETATMASANPASVPTSGSPAGTTRAGSDTIELRQAPGLAPVGAAPAVAPALAPQPAPADAATIPTLLGSGIDSVTTPISASVTPRASPILAGVTAAAEVIPVIPSITETSFLYASPGVNEPFVTVQWIETTIGGTYSTWVPNTIIFDFKPYRTQAPLPGKGEIGMGTLTGKTGQTQTVMVGAAPTQGPGWVKGVAAVVGVGIAGMVV